MVPNAFGVDHGDGTLGADAQAVGLGSEYFADGLQIQLTESAFEVIPRNNTLGPLAAFVFSLVTTEKNMPFDIIRNT